MIDSTFQFHEFANGIRLIHKEVPSKLGHLGVLLNTGSRDEAEEEHGIAHFIEHSIFKGTKKRKAFHVLSRMEDVGGELNAYTTKEETALFATFLGEYYERATELLSDILFQSTYPEKELEREKEVVMEEINSYKDSPSELIFDEFEELVYDGHPIARNILGTPEKLRSFHKPDIYRFIENNYHTDHIVISSVGNISFTKLVHLCEKYFGSIPPSLRNKERQKFENYIPSEKILTKDTFQAHCVIGNTGFDSNHPQRTILVLLNSLLGGHSMNSRLNLSLRERRGIAYNVESNFTPYTDIGLFSVYFGTDKENLEKAISIVYSEFQKLKHNKLGPVQLLKAKKQLIGQLAISVENREELMLAIGKSYLLYGNVDPMIKVYEKIEQVTASQLMEVANLILDESKMSRLIYR